MQTIRDTIPHAKGIEGIAKESFDKNQPCPAMPACMVGKAHLEIRPLSRGHAKRPLGRVRMDIKPSSIPSIKGYNYALVIVDDSSIY